MLMLVFTKTRLNTLYRISFDTSFSYFHAKLLTFSPSRYTSDLSHPYRVDQTTPDICARGWRRPRQSLGDIEVFEGRWHGKYVIKLCVTNEKWKKSLGIGKKVRGTKGQKNIIRKNRRKIPSWLFKNIHISHKASPPWFFLCSGQVLEMTSNYMLCKTGKPEKDPL